MPRIHRQSDHRPQPAAVVLQPIPELYRVALRLADGDPHRLRIEDEGSILVLNRSRYERRA